MGINDPIGGSTSKKTTTSKPKESQSLFGKIGSALGDAAGAVGRFIGRTAKDAQRVFSPIVHDLGAAFIDAADEFIPGWEFDPKYRFADDYAEELAERIKKTPTTIKNLVQGISKPIKGENTLGKIVPDQLQNALHAAVESPLGMIVPGITTIDQMTTKSGMKQIGEHPGFAILDLLPVLGKVSKATKAISKAIGEPLRETKLGTTAGAKFEKAIQKTNPAAAKRGSLVHSIPREAMQSVADSMGSISKQLGKLSDEETAALFQALPRGEAPPVGTKARDIYDSIAEHQATTGAAKLTRRLPEEYTNVIKMQTLFEKQKGKKFTLYEELREGLSGLGLVGEAADDVMALVANSFLSDAPLPISGVDKLVKTLDTKFKQKFYNAQAKYHTYEEPLTGAQYSLEEVRKFRKAMSTPGKGANLSKIARDVEADLRGTLDDLGPNKPNMEVLERYKQTLNKMPPGQWATLLQAFKDAADAAEAQRLVVPGVGEATTRRVIDALRESRNANIVELWAQGTQPVYVPREALAGVFEVPRPIAKRSTAPASLKSAQGNAAAYAQDGFMMFKDELSQALQHTTLKVMGQLLSENGKFWDLEMSKLKGRGFKDAKANSLLKDKFSRVNIDTAGNVTFSEAGPGSIMVNKSLANVMEHYFSPPEWLHKGVTQAATGVWIVPTLLLSPIFHVNNILSGAALTGMRLKPSGLIRLGKDIAEAMTAAKRGRIIDPRIPSGRGQMPMFKEFTSSRSAELAHLEYGRMVGKTFKDWAKQTGAHPLRSLTDLAERGNQFWDQAWRNLVALNHSPDFRKTGRITDEALGEASRLMQDLDSLMPIEREVLQRVFPFWAWKRTMIKVASTYPLDHPIRTTILTTMARQHEEQREVAEAFDMLMLQNLPIDASEDLTMLLSLRGVDPFHDLSSLHTVKGWLNSLHPGVQSLFEFFGVSPYLGGVPAWRPDEDETQIDPETGLPIRKYNPKAFIDAIPQMRALQTYLEIDPPNTDDYEGWWNWWKKYGTSLRILPAITYLNLKKEEEEMAARETTHPTAYRQPNRVNTTEPQIKSPVYRGGAEVITETTPYQNPNRQDVTA